MNTLQIAIVSAGAAVASAMLSTAASAATAGDAARGKARSIVCTGCHGIPGTRAAFPDLYPVPKLGGQHAEYIVSALKSYQAGQRYNQTMRAQASALSEQDMADIAAYYSGENAGTNASANATANAGGKK